jgi:hypothetical protein
VVEFLMSEGAGELIPIPKEGAKVAFIGFSLSIDFYPAIRISRKDGLEFTAELAEIFEPEDVHLEGSEWRINGGGICEGIQLVIEKRSFRVFVLPPPGSTLERYEQKIDALLRAFEHKFEPKAALRFNVDLSGLVDLPEGVDSRAFLGGYVMLMHPRKLDAIERPLDILGVRLRFPATDDIEWAADVRIESWGTDPRKIFLNVSADWETQTAWGLGFVDGSVNRISTVSDFIEKTLVQFLRQPRIPDDFDDEEDIDNGS